VLLALHVCYLVLILYFIIRLLNQHVIEHDVLMSRDSLNKGFSNYDVVNVLVKAGLEPVYAVSSH